MRKLSGKRFVATMMLALWAVSIPGSAGVEEAKAAYARGMALEKTKNYAGAAMEFEAALRESPNYFYAIKQLGTCRYYLGDKAAALGCYEAYLQQQPSDTAAASFAQSLRKAGVQATPFTLPGDSTAPAASAPSERGTGKRFGLRVGGGYAGGLGGESYGRNVSTGGGYLVSPGAGLAYSIEPLFALNDRIEFGLGFFSSGFSASGSSSYTSNPGNNVTQDSSTYAFSTVPIIASVYIKQPVWKKLSLVLGFGAGYATGGDMVQTSDQTSTSGGSPSGTDNSISIISVDGGVAYRAALGAEYSFGKNLSVFGGFSFLGANYPISKSVSTDVQKDSSGNATSDTSYTTTYTADAPKKKETPTSSTTNTVSFSGGVYEVKSDDGVTQSTIHQDYGPGVVLEYQSITYTTLQQKGPTHDLSQLSFQIGATYRF